MLAWGRQKGGCMESFDELARIQRNTATRLRREDELNRKVRLMALIQGLNPNKQGHILLELILIEARQEGFLEEEVAELLGGLERDGFLRRVDDGVVVLI